MSITPENVCIIPARGGSKRIPKKNIKNFLGKPIIAYSIQSALASGLFKEVMVSTDDEEIASLAQGYGATVPFIRSARNANDYATTMDVLKEVIDQYEQQGLSFQNICCLYPTAPFVSAKVLNDAYQLFTTKNYDSLFPIIKYSFPIQRSLKLVGDKLKSTYPEFINTRSQDLESVYHDAGQFYWLKKSMLASDTLVSTNTGGYIISELQGQDIDSEVDWKLAELKYELL